MTKELARRCISQQWQESVSPAVSERLRFTTGETDAFPSGGRGYSSFIIARAGSTGSKGRNCIPFQYYGGGKFTCKEWKRGQTKGGYGFAFASAIYYLRTVITACF